MGGQQALKLCGLAIGSSQDRSATNIGFGTFLVEQAVHNAPVPLIIVGFVGICVHPQLDLTTHMGLRPRRSNIQPHFWVPTGHGVNPGKKLRKDAVGDVERYLVGAPRVVQRISGAASIFDNCDGRLHQVGISTAETINRLFRITDPDHFFHEPTELSKQC